MTYIIITFKSSFYFFRESSNEIQQKLVTKWRNTKIYLPSKCKLLKFHFEFSLQEYFIRICCQLGQFYENRRDVEKSLQFYQEALVNSPHDIKIMLSIANMYILISGDLDRCFQMCQNVLIQDQNNDMATLVGFHSNVFGIKV